MVACASPRNAVTRTQGREMQPRRHEDTKNARRRIHKPKNLTTRKGAEVRALGSGWSLLRRAPGKRAHQIVDAGPGPADLLFERAELRLAPRVAREQRLRSLHQFVGDGVDRARQPAEQAGDVAVARVYVRRDLLQEDDQEAFEAGKRLDVRAQH